MANVVVTVKTTDKSIEIAFNDLSEQPGVLMHSAIIYKGQPVRLERNDDGVEVVLHGEAKLDLNYNIVDTIDGVAVNDNDQLYQLLDTIITTTIVPS